MRLAEDWWHLKLKKQPEEKLKMFIADLTSLIRESALSKDAGDVGSLSFVSGENWLPTQPMPSVRLKKGSS